MAFGFSGGSAENIRPRPPLREDFAVIREEPNLRVAFTDNPEEEYEVERLDSQGNATVVGSSSSPDILVPSQAQEHRVVARNKELGIRGTPSVPKKELKPTQRWQMPQPRNLFESNDSGSATNFDPATTAWRPFGLTYNGTVDNVGPNGETAHSFTVDSSGADLKQLFSDVDAPLTVGAFVRAKSSQFSASTIFRNSDSGSSISKSVTVDTDWSWVTSTNTSQDAVDELRVFDGLPSGSTFYILRAVLNRGNSRLFSTRSQVPQEIPDVVQGGDLQNGTTDSPDTNDLDFGVDAEGVPYAVSDGDDQASGTVLKGNGTIAISYYVSSSSSVDKGVILEENANNFQIAPRRDRNGFRIVVKDPQGNDFLLRNGGLGSSTQDAWQQAIITRVNDTDLRFNFNGTELSYSFNQKYDDSDLKISVADGRRVRQVETHPVLSEAEAEAVRQRLATNPADPVAPTEAWDSTVGSGSTLPALRQSSNDISVGASVSWVDPIGLSDGGGGSLLTPTNRSTVTWIERVKYTATRAFGRSANGWKVTATDLVVEDTGGNTASAAHGKTINDGVYHTLAVTIDEVTGTAEVYIDGATSPDATVDLSTVGTLKSSDVELLAEGGTIKQPAYYTRALSGEEIAYLHERLVDNPETAHPEYTNP